MQIASMSGGPLDISQGDGLLGVARAASAALLLATTDAQRPAAVFLGQSSAAPTPPNAELHSQF